MTARQAKKTIRNSCHSYPRNLDGRRSTLRAALDKQLRCYNRWAATGAALTIGCREGRWDPVRPGRPASPTPATEEAS